MQSLRTVSVDASPPPRELSKKPLVMLLWGRPEVKTLINILPAQQGKEKKKEALYSSGAPRSPDAVGGKERGGSRWRVRRK